MSALSSINTNHLSRAIEARGVTNDHWAKVPSFLKEEGGPGLAPLKDALKLKPDELEYARTFIKNPELPKQVAFHVLTKVFVPKSLLKALDGCLNYDEHHKRAFFNHRTFCERTSKQSRYLKGMLMHLFEDSGEAIDWYLDSYAALKDTQRAHYVATAKDFAIDLSDKTGEAYAKKYNKIDFAMAIAKRLASQAMEKKQDDEQPVSQDGATITTKDATKEAAASKSSTTATATTTKRNGATTTDVTSPGSTTAATTTGGTTTAATTTATATTINGVPVQVVLNEAGEMIVDASSIQEDNNDGTNDEMITKYGVKYVMAHPDKAIEASGQWLGCNPSDALKDKPGANLIPKGIIVDSTWYGLFIKIRKICYPLFKDSPSLAFIRNAAALEWETYQTLVLSEYLPKCLPSRWKDLARAITEYGQVEEAKIASLAQFKFSPDQYHAVYRAFMGNSHLIEGFRRIFQNHPEYRQQFDKVFATLESMLSGTRASPDTSGVATTNANTAAQEVRVNILNNLERMVTDSIVGTNETGFQYSQDSIFDILKRCVIESFEIGGPNAGDRIDHLADKLARAFPGQLAMPLWYKFAGYVNVYFVLGESRAHAVENSCNPSAVKAQLLKAFSPATLGNSDDIRDHIIGVPAICGLFFLIVGFAWAFDGYKKLTPSIDNADDANTLTETLDNFLRTLEEKAAYFDLIFNNSGVINSAPHETEMMKNNSDITKLTRTTGSAINRLYVLRIILEDKKLPFLAHQYNYNGICKKRGQEKIINGLKDEYIDLCLKNKFDNKFRKDEEKKKNNTNNNNEGKNDRKNNDDANRRARSPEGKKKDNNKKNKKNNNPQNEEDERQSEICPQHRCSKVQESSAKFGNHTGANCRYKGTGIIFKWNPFKKHHRTKEKGMWEYDIGAMRAALRKPKLQVHDARKMDVALKAKWAKEKAKNNNNNADAAEAANAEEDAEE